MISSRAPGAAALAGSARPQMHHHDYVMHLVVDF
jgi:hypothetical protein